MDTYNLFQSTRPVRSATIPLYGQRRMQEVEHKNERNSKKVPDLREIAENFSPECRDAILDYADQLDRLNEILRSLPLA